MKLLFEGWKKFLKEAHEPVGPGPSAGELMGRARENFPPDVLARAGYGEEEPEPSTLGRSTTAMNLLEDVMEQISAAYNSLDNPADQETFERYLNENVAEYSAKWQEERESDRDDARYGER